MIYDAVIIGAGPSGSYLAKKLVENNLKICVIEKEKEIGLPIQCTGLFTNKIKKFVDMDNEFVVNKLNKVILNSKTNNIKINSEEFVVDRSKFDKYLAKQAKKSGVKYFLNSCFNNYQINADGTLKLRINKKKYIDTKRVIGCDGPLSTVNRIFKLNKDNKNFFAKQFVIKTKEKIDSKSYNAYFGDEYKDFFGWSVACSKNCLRIGVGSSNFNIVNKRLNNFKKKFKGKIIETNAGLIPIYNSNRILFKKIKNSSVYLIGDAASIVKASSGGGVVLSFEMIDECYKKIIQNKKLTFPKVRFELATHLIIHKLISKLNDEEYEEIFNELNEKKIKKIISKINRDNVNKLLFNLILKNPKLLKYLKFLLKII